VHPARYARAVSKQAGLLARDLVFRAENRPAPAFSPRERGNGVWGPEIAHSCGGSRGMVFYRVPVSALSGHLLLGDV
jgi:hypothetical protein